MKPLPRGQLHPRSAFHAAFERSERPVVLTGAADRWTARNRWSLEYFREQYGHCSVMATLALPAEGVPYEATARDHVRRTTLEAVIRAIANGQRAYVGQTDIDTFPGLADQIDLSELIEGTPTETNVWLGAKTRSGLHYDSRNNFLVQIVGTKHATLASPDDTAFLYPYPDNVSKSRIDPDAPDERAYPRVARATLLEARLEPGDALFIPRGWWHHLRSDAMSISVNAWYGETLPLKRQLRMAAAGGPRVAARTIRDFVWHGLLARPWEPRLYSPPPTGVELFHMLREALKR